MKEDEVLKYYEDFRKKLERKYKMPIAQINIKDVKGAVEIEIIPDIPVTKISSSNASLVIEGEEKEAEETENENENENE